MGFFGVVMQALDTTKNTIHSAGCNILFIGKTRLPADIWGTQIASYKVLNLSSYLSVEKS